MKKSILAWILIACLSLMGTAALAEGASEKTWEEAIGDYYANYALTMEANSPKVTTLENGVKIQRTPADYLAHNTRILNADQRGCAACHPNLNDTVVNMKDFEALYGTKHLDMDRYNDAYGVETTIQSCYACHSYESESWNGHLGTLIHGLHENSSIFTSMGGDCMSCHVVNKMDGSFMLWEDARHTMLRGVSTLSNPELSFAYEQGQLTDQFSLTYVMGLDDLTREKRIASNTPKDPAKDYEEFMIQVRGAMEKPYTMSLAEMIRTFPSETFTMTNICTMSTTQLVLMETCEYTGIPMSAIFEHAGMFENASVYNVGYESMMGMIPMPIEMLKDSYIVYETNGEPLSWEAGYPTVMVTKGAFAGTMWKTPSIIEAYTPEEMPGFEYWASNGKYHHGEKINYPYIVLTHLREGQIIEKDKPHTFTGIAFALYNEVDAIEVSFDNGQNWTRFDCADSKPEVCVNWSVEWTPVQEGSYIIMARAVDSQGNATSMPAEILFNVQ